MGQGQVICNLKVSTPKKWSQRAGTQVKTPRDLKNEKRRDADQEEELKLQQEQKEELLRQQQEELERIEAQKRQQKKEVRDLGLRKLCLMLEDKLQSAKLKSLQNVIRQLQMVANQIQVQESFAYQFQVIYLQKKSFGLLRRNLILEKSGKMRLRNLCRIIKYAVGEGVERELRETIRCMKSIKPVPFSRVSKRANKANKKSGIGKGTKEDMADREKNKGTVKE